MATQLADHSIRIACDRGGTFTDVHASWVPTTSDEGGEGGEGNGDAAPQRKEITLKLLSVHDHYPDAPREGVRRVLELITGEEYPRDALLPVDKIASIRLSTTVATNALLERQGAKHALVVTKGFGDLLQIGNQSRPKIFELDIKRPSVLYSDVLEVDERVTLMGYTSDPKRAERAVVFAEDGKVEKHYDDEELPEGEVVKGMSGEAVRIIKRVEEDTVRKDLQRLYDEGYRSLAIVLIHAFTFPDHERQIAEIAKKIGFEHISASSSSLPMIRMVARGTSTTVDAYLTPVLQKYLDGFFAGFDPSLRDTNTGEQMSAEEAKETTSVEFMRSDGGLTDVRGFSGLKSILSGPAGGVVGFAQTSWEEGGKAVIGLDMGGTSTDVSRFDGTHEIVMETTTAGVTVQSPQLNIETLFWRNGLFVVGPESVGSNPGPACYRKGGQPAITDANLVLGRLIPAYFPKIFGETEDEALDVEASKKALEKLKDEVNEETGKSLSTDEVAWGFIKVANETMCRPIRSLTEARGYDASKHILAGTSPAPFGGAGGQHACAIASTLGIKTILVHRYSSILSAYGMALAERVFERQEPSSETWSDSSAPRLKARLSALGKEVHSELERQGFSSDRIEIHPYLNCRYTGTDSALMIHEPEEGESFAQAFAKAYKQEFSFSMPNVDIIVDDVRVRGVGKSFDSLGDSVFTEAKKLEFKAVGREPSKEDRQGAQQGKCAETASVYFEEKGRVEVPVFLLERLEAGDLVEGPAMILDGQQTLVIDPEAKAKITTKHVMIELP